MRYYMLIFLVFILCSCSKNETKIASIKNNEFITQPGKYYFKSVRIVVKEFKDGSLIYGLTDNRNNILYQQSLVGSFKNAGWLIFVDDHDNIWFHTQDLGLTSVLLRQKNVDLTYVYKKINEKKIMPQKMIDEMAKFQR